MHLTEPPSNDTPNYISDNEETCRELAYSLICLEKAGDGWYLSTSQPRTQYFLWLEPDGCVDWFKDTKSTNGLILATSGGMESKEEWRTSLLRRLDAVPVGWFGDEE